MTLRLVRVEPFPRLNVLGATLRSHLVISEVSLPATDGRESSILGLSVPRIEIR